MLYFIGDESSIISDQMNGDSANDEQFLESGSSDDSGFNGVNFKNQEIKQEFNNNKLVSKDLLFDPSAFAPYDPEQEPIFPPELKVSLSLDLS